MTLFTPYPDWSAPTMDYAKAREVHRVDLHEIPLESVIEFYGKHLASQYICKITETEPYGRAIKLWFFKDANCAIDPIDSMMSLDLARFKPGVDESFVIEKGVMEWGKCYVLPNFDRVEKDRDSIVLRYSCRRMEGYSKIFPQIPEEGRK